MEAVQYKIAKFAIGTPVEHRHYGFRGVVFDVDPEFDSTDEWYNAIPEDVRPDKDQPFYHVLAVTPENDSPYVAYVSEQNLQYANPEDEIDHPGLGDYFVGMENGMYVPRYKSN